MANGNLTLQNVHVNVPLTDFTLGYHPRGFIARQVFNEIPVSKESGLYYTWDQQSAFQASRSDGLGSLRADGAPSLTLDFKATKSSFLAEEYAYNTKITDRARKQADDALRLEQSKARRLKDILMGDLELRVANLVTTAANYASSNTTTLSGTNQWNNASFSSTPTGQQSAIVNRLMTGREAIRTSTGGYDPTHIIIPPSVEAVMVNDPGLTQRQYYVEKTLTGAPSMGDTFLGMQVLRPRAMYTTSVEGTGTVTYSDVWGKNVIMFYRPDSVAIDDLMFGALFLAQDWTTTSWRDERTKCDYYETSIIEDEVAVAFACGYLIKNAIA